MENDRIAKRVYRRWCTGSHLADLPRKKWIDSVNDCLKKRCLNVGQDRRIVCHRNEWREFVRRNAGGMTLG